MKKFKLFYFILFFILFLSNNLRASSRMPVTMDTSDPYCYKVLAAITGLITNRGTRDPEFVERNKKAISGLTKLRDNPKFRVAECFDCVERDHLEGLKEDRLKNDAKGVSLSIECLDELKRIKRIIGLKNNILYNL